MRRIWLIAALLLLPVSARAEGVLGQWMTPAGATIEIYRCNTNVCARVVALNKDAPSRIDSNNPDSALRKHSLCGLQIGREFHLTDSNHADDGRLYDPKSGKTYNGSMASDGNSLKLRGYIGIRLFGRSEIWTRAGANVAACRE